MEDLKNVFDRNSYSLPSGGVIMSFDQFTAAVAEIEAAKGEPAPAISEDMLRQELASAYSIGFVKESGMSDLSQEQIEAMNKRADEYALSTIELRKRMETKIEPERNKPFDIIPDPMTLEQLKTWFEEWYGIGTFPVKVVSDEEIEKMAKDTYFDLIFMGVSKAEALTHKISWSKGAKWMRSRIIGSNTTGD